MAMVKRAPQAAACSGYRAWQIMPAAPLFCASQASSSGVPRWLAGTQTAPARKQASIDSSIWLQLGDWTRIRSPLRHAELVDERVGHRLDAGGHVSPQLQRRSPQIDRGAVAVAPRGLVEQVREVHRPRGGGRHRTRSSTEA